MPFAANNSTVLHGIRVAVVFSFSPLKPHAESATVLDEGFFLEDSYHVITADQEHEKVSTAMQDLFECAAA